MVRTRKDPPALVDPRYEEDAMQEDEERPSEEEEDAEFSNQNLRTITALRGMIDTNLGVLFATDDGAHSLLGRDPSGGYLASIYTLNPEGENSHKRESLIGPFSGNTRIEALKKLLKRVESNVGNMQASDHEEATPWAKSKAMAKGGKNAKKGGDTKRKDPDDGDDDDASAGRPPAKVQKGRGGKGKKIN
ncbi:hypothetical protein BCR34DRAFT_618226 [Clohesyomyces aquaticus]|uniref:Uncharacterized protein n=1 Tax=Clohesyomyces aquaticus TaxID=1231657 RepID=A0A1Y1YUZ8_9PLEO|nr:hypothetical protein BCR34DRAFT_618226 [Clohesyomyces aquaticus]